MFSEHFHASLKEGMDQKQLNWDDVACYRWSVELSQLQRGVEIFHS